MHTSYEQRGLWWLPQAAHRKVPGAVQFSGVDGTTLDLEGFLTESPHDEAGQRLSLIHGITRDGECITIEDCQRGTTKSGSGVPEVRYHCGPMYVGRYHLVSSKRVRTRAIEVKYSNLDEWADCGNFIVKSEGLGKHVIICEPFQERMVAETDDFQLAFRNAVSSGPRSLVQTEFSIRQQWLACFKTSEDRPISQLIDWIFSFQQFLTLAMGGRCHPTSAVIVIEKSAAALEAEAQHYREMFARLSATSGEPPTPSNEIRLSVYISHTSLRTDTREIRRDDMIFTLESAGAQMEVAVQNWFSKAALLKPVTDFYFGALFSSQIYAEHYFLSMTQVLETFHRRTIQDTVALIEKHKKRGERIRFVVDQGNRSLTSADGSVKPDEGPLTNKEAKWLDKQLAFGYEPNLEERLHQLLKRIPTDDLELLIGDSEAVKYFQDRVRISRNYYTHFDEKYFDRSAHGYELVTLGRKLGVIIQMCLLETLGFGPEHFRRAIPRNLR